MSDSSCGRPVVKIDNFVRRHTTVAAVETLHQCGVGRVNLLTFSKVNELVSMAVATAFQKYRRSDNDDDARKVEAVARAVLLKDLDAFGNGARDDAGNAAREIEVLQRRIEKLRENISQMERALKELHARSGEPGIPSIYREVQGLGAAESDYEVKKSLSRIVFEENLKLQRKDANDLQRRELQ